MNRSRPHHNICGVASKSGCNRFRRLAGITGHPESGYALVSLLAVMTVLALFALAAAPSIRQQGQREREKEAIFRGEQVSDAIRSYYLYRRGVLGVAGDQALPTSMDQLLEGIPIPGGSKKVQILRPSAARDPLSETGEWGFVTPRSQKLIEFQESVMVYSGNFLPTPRTAQLIELQRLMVPQIVSISPQGLSSTNTQSEDFSDDASGPFVGVSSRSRRNAVLYYYGIEHHNQWIFTPLFKW